jgi:hypothetical protein
MTHEELKANALSNQKVKDEYDSLAPEFSLAYQGLTQIQSLSRLT